MTATEVADLVQKLGFPVVIALAFGWFAWKLVERFIGHLEKTVEKQDKVNEKFTSTLTEISSTMQTVATAQRENMTEFRTTAPSICRNYDPRAKP